MNRKNFQKKYGLKNIQGRLSLILICTATFVFSGFAFSNYAKTKSDMNANFYELTGFVASQLSKSLIMPIWNMNHKTGKDIADSIMLEKQVYAILVKDEYDDVFYGKIRDVDWGVIEYKEEFSKDDYYMERKDILKGDKKIGIVEVYMTFEFMQTKLDDSIANMLMALVILNGSLFFIFFLSIRKGVIFPVRRIINSVNNGTDQILFSSEQIASATQSLAQGTSEQAAASEETSSSLEELSSMIRQNAKNAVQSDVFMKNVMHVIEKADKSMNRLADSMKEIIQVGEQASEIVKTIDGIAFQTNLLSLNAAVEAARAGEAGGGFAVVADEVRNLAMRTAQAAQNTSELIERTLKKIQISGEITSETRSDFDDVTHHSARVGELISEIAETSDDQSLRIGQLNHAVTDMDRVTQKNAANAEETAAATREMKVQAERINANANELAVLVGAAFFRKHANARRKDAGKQFPDRESS